MRSLILISLGLLLTLSAAAQIACPVALTDARADHDRIRLSFRNKGKVPIEQLTLSCTPTPSTDHAACHSQTGIFYPGTPYWINIPYPNANRRSITVAISSVQIAGGGTWTTESSSPCRPLHVRRRP